MSATLIVFIIIHVIILVFFVESLRRMAMRVREYPLEETHETLPLGFLRLRYVIVFYVLIYITWVLFSIWLYNLFVEPSSAIMPEQFNTPNDVLLNM